MMFVSLSDRHCSSRLGLGMCVARKFCWKVSIRFVYILSYHSCTENIILIVGALPVPLRKWLPWTFHNDLEVYVKGVRCCIELLAYNQFCCTVKYWWVDVKRFCPNTLKELILVILYYVLFGQTVAQTRVIIVLASEVRESWAWTMFWWLLKE